MQRYLVNLCGVGVLILARSYVKKGLILDRILDLDVMPDSVGLSTEEWLQRYAFEAFLMEIYKGKEVFWRQWSRQNWLLKGDANTVYFHAIANGRRRKCSIPYLWEDDHLLEDASDISTHIYSFKELFTTGPRSGVMLVGDFFGQIGLWNLLMRIWS
jgi:mannosylglycoprotein endo-beta-mannosidase